MKENITEAMDHINTVMDILDYLSNTRKENGLCSILDHCHQQLMDANDELMKNLNTEEIESWEGSRK
jgi:hypothetical protein